VPRHHGWEPLHYTNDPHLKLDQTKCNTAVYIESLLATPPKMVHGLIWAVYPLKNVH